MIQGECKWEVVEEPQCSAETPPSEESVDIDPAVSDTSESDVSNSSKTQTNVQTEKSAPRRHEEPKVLQLETFPKDEPQCPIDFPMEDDWYCDNAEDRFQII